MNYIDEEIQATILNGWRNNQTCEEVSEELVKFFEFVKLTEKLYRNKLKRNNPKKKTPQHNLRSGSR